VIDNGFFSTCKVHLHLILYHFIYFATKLISQVNSKEAMRETPFIKTFHSSRLTHIVFLQTDACESFRLQVNSLRLITFRTYFGFIKKRNFQTRRCIWTNFTRTTHVTDVEKIPNVPTTHQHNANECLYQFFSLSFLKFFKLNSSV
jgi:hypothetical protein